MKIGTTGSQKNLEEMIIRCHDAKEKEKAINKITSDLSKKIKNELLSQGLSEFNVPEVCCVKCSESTSDSVNEEKLITIITKLIKDEQAPEVAESLKSCIEYIPAINEKRVQQLIHQGIINIEDIAPAMETKVTTRLTFSKPKKGGSENV